MKDETCSAPIKTFCNIKSNRKQVHQETDTSRQSQKLSKTLRTMQNFPSSTEVDSVYLERLYCSCSNYLIKRGKSIDKTPEIKGCRVTYKD